jgi:hypothetical protein
VCVERRTWALDLKIPKTHLPFPLLSSRLAGYGAVSLSGYPLNGYGLVASRL